MKECDSDAVEFFCEREIFFRQTASVVCRQSERDFVPADINVRMMPRLFSELGDGVDELDGRREIFEDERARDGFVALLPIRQSSERSLDLGGGQFIHAD